MAGEDFGFDLPTPGIGADFPVSEAGVLTDFQVPGGGGGFQNWLDKVGTGATDFLGKIGTSIEADPLGALTKGLQLGTAGVGIGAGISSMRQGAKQTDILNRAEKRQEQVTQPAVDFGTNILKAGETGLLTNQLPPGLEAVVQDWKQKQKAQIESYLARSGTGDSSQRNQWMAWLDQQEQVMRGQLAGNLAEQGLQGIQVGAGANTQVMTAAAQRSSNITGLLGNASRALGAITGSQDTRKLQDQNPSA